MPDEQPLNTNRIGDKIAPWVDEAITRHGQGEQIAWELALLPGPQGQPMPVLMFWVKGALLGSVVNGSIGLHDPLAIGHDDLVEAVRQFLEQMRQARSEQLQQQAPASPHLNGSGLLLPGR